MAERLSCPCCGFDDVGGLLVGHPLGFEGGAAVAIDIGLPCCGHRPTNDEAKAWARIVYASRRNEAS